MSTYLLAWFPMLFLAVVNGILREAFIKKRTDESTAHQISTVTLIFFLGCYIYYIIQRFPPLSFQQAVLVSLIWMVLTLLFEFGMGLFRGLRCSAMLADYNLLKGRLWALVPLWILISPPLFFWVLPRQ